MKAELKVIERKIEESRACDPEVINRLVTGAEVCKETANRWTDNISIMQSFYKDKLSGMTDAKFFDHFGLPKDFDYLE